MRDTAQRARSWAARLATLTLLATASGCITEVQQQPPFTTANFTVAEFNPSTGKLPFPLTLTCTVTDPATGACKSGGTFDPVNGRVALPITPCGATPTPGCDSASGAQLKAGLNTLDGFSTYGNLKTTFDKDVNPASVNKRTAFLLDSTTGQPADFSPTLQDAKTLLFMADIPSAPESITAAARPLKPETTYFAVVTTAVQDAMGRPLESDSTFAFVKSKQPVAGPNGEALAGSPLASVSAATRISLEGLRQGFAPIFSALESAPTPIAREKIALLWPVRTQSTAKAFLGLRAALVAVAPVKTAPPQGNIPGVAVYTGAGDPVIPGATPLPPGVPRRVGNFQLGCLRTATLTSATTGAFDVGPSGPRFRPHFVPYVASFPSTPAPATGYPVVIFGHGFTRWRYDMIAIANSLAIAGFATIAIDHPYHGDRSNAVAGQENDDPLRCGPSAPAASPPFRCSDPTGVYTPNMNPMMPGTCSAGTPVASGQRFLNPANLFATRDNFRQAILDLMMVNRTIKASTTATGAPTYDATKIVYAGQSLGGILGTVFTAVEPDVKAAVLNVPGGGLANIIENTGTAGICKPVVDGLKAAGVCEADPTRVGPSPADCKCKPTPAYTQFIATAQWILDPADSINFGWYLIDRPLYCQTPAGPAPCALAPTAPPIKKKVLIQRMTGDLVVPNLTTNALVGAVGTKGCYRDFTGGDHGFLLSPTASPAATSKGQAQAVSFLASGGTVTADGQDSMGNPTGVAACPQ